MRSEHRLAVHKFNSEEDLTFSPVEYSQLKFGCGAIARKYGYQLADAVFNAHSGLLLSNKCVVIPSPYNFVPNAASIMARHMIDRLNHHMVSAQGDPVEWSVIHRKVNYTNDYGFLPKEQRKALINGDEFHFNSAFVEGKTLLFVDDVYITGTHEDKLKDIMDCAGMDNTSLFLYFGQAGVNVKPELEAALNFAGMPNLKAYVDLINGPDHHLIVRPIKYILSQKVGDLIGLLDAAPKQFAHDLYMGCIGEGYHKIPAYQEGFLTIKQRAGM